MEDRVHKLEADVRVCQLQIDEIKESSRDEIRELKQAIRVLEQGFSQIQNLITSIKWWVIGAVSLMAIKEFGLTKVLMTLLGVPQ